MDFTATWYTPAGGVGSGLVTASGLPVDDRTIAVDPSIIPLGSICQLKFADGHIETKLASDTGGAIHGHIIDVFTWSNDMAVQNGRQKIQISVIGHQDIGR